MDGRVVAALRDPLLHFAVLAALVFATFELVTPDGAGLGEDVIVVDRQALLTHLQYRTRTFEANIAEQRLAGLSNDAFESMVREYVREEALHREALAMGMDANDYIIKRRLIQKVEFLAEGFADASIDVQEEDLLQHLAENRADYYVEPKATFTHVFFSAQQQGGMQRALERANSVLGDLRGKGFNDAGGLGDRFPYHRNYVEQNERAVASHFGPEFAQTVFASPADEGVWRGPHQSTLGAHVVLVSRVEPGRNPELDEIRLRVTENVRRVVSKQRLDAALDEIVANYEVLRAYEHTPTQGQVNASSGSAQ